MHLDDDGTSGDESKTMRGYEIDATHDPDRRSWLASANGHPDFPIQNLPFGCFSIAGRRPRIGVAIGEQILDLRSAAADGLLPVPVRSASKQGILNDLFGLPAEARLELRHCLSNLLSDPYWRSRLERHFRPASDCALHLPARIGDYSDFYVGIHHAGNVGRLFRPDAPLLPNYKHIPIGYHGRASSVRESGVAVRRPSGQIRKADVQHPVRAPTAKLDYELELGLWVGKGNPLGHSIPVAEAWTHMAGLCLLNDWSARDIQAWEYQPLGPFLSKNFHTTISPWVVTMEALAPFPMVVNAREADDPEPLPYLADGGGGIAIRLEVSIRTARMRAAGAAPFRIGRSDTSAMFWSFAQIIAHHASNGCNLSAGDLLGTGTLSLPDRDGAGSLLEISRNGVEPLMLPNGETRSFLADGDEISLRGVAEAEGRVPIGFGPCVATILPAHIDES